MIFLIFSLVFFQNCRTYPLPPEKKLGMDYFPLKLIYEIQNRENLSFLELHSPKFKNSDLEELPPMPELEILSISRSNLTYLKHFTKTKYPNLTTIYANHTFISSLDLEDWKDPPPLDKLFLNDTKITDLAWTQNFSKIRRLSIEDNKITDISMLALQKNLVELWLGGTQVNSIEPLLGTNSLNYIGIDGLNIPEQAIKNFQKSMPYVKIVRRSPIF
jgi:Leucine-rich repeat (LRR) protein